jgi:hypothetical protein
MTGHVAKMEPDDFGPLTDLNSRRYSEPDLKLIE